MRRRDAVGADIETEPGPLRRSLLHRMDGCGGTIRAIEEGQAPRMPMGSQCLILPV
ncbi:MAG: hypothetical protein VX000_16390 [Myxococcota bacterium]|nr:hypothetical protein [Myxococcota bacterium]